MIVSTIIGCFMNWLGKYARALGAISFPEICVCCGDQTSSRRQPICPFCMGNRFEDGNPQNRLSCSGQILPETVRLQHALWRFDKGGDLQELLHHLKYAGIIDIGYQLGRRLGRRLRLHPRFVDMVRHDNVILLPVPLHPARYRRRGFNQAAVIARGLQEEWRLPICRPGDIIRSRHTPTQTGLPLEKRLSNLENAFVVRRPESIEGRLVLIVDDVFTTGATTFELARVLRGAGMHSASVLTVARA